MFDLVVNLSNALAFVATLALTLSGRKSLGDLIGASIGLALAFPLIVGSCLFFILLTII